MKYIYPAVFHPEEEGGYSIYFPDIGRGATQGDTLQNGMEMAQDFLCLALYDMEESETAIPAATTTAEIEAESNDIVTLVMVNTDDYRRYYSNKLVKKTLNIPSWLNQKAEAANINFSQTLQSALKNELQINE